MASETKASQRASGAEFRVINPQEAVSKYGFESRNNLNVPTVILVGKGLTDRRVSIIMTGLRDLEQIANKPTPLHPTHQEIAHFVDDYTATAENISRAHNVFFSLGPPLGQPEINQLMAAWSITQIRNSSSN